MKINKIIYLLLAAFLFVSCDKSNPVQSKVMQTDNKLISEYDKLVDNCFKEYSKKSYNAGFSIALIDNNKVYKYNYGETSLGNGILPDSQTLYEIGSITKVFSAITLYQFLRKNNIDINSEIKEYLPTTLKYKLNKNGEEITFKQLLNHTSGLERIPVDLPNNNNPYNGYDSTKIFNYLITHELIYTPGKLPANENELISQYSNLAYALVGIILERNLNNNLNSIFEEYVFNKANMVSSKLDLLMGDNVCSPHNPFGKTEYWSMSGFAAAGGLKSNINDLVNFLLICINGSTDAILEQAINDCTIPTVYLNSQPVFGLGFEFFTNNNNKTLIVKDGGTGGFTSFIAYNKELKKGIVALFNNNNDSNQAKYVVNLFNSFFK